MKVEKIKKSGKKYNLILEDDSKITTYDDVIIENGLLYHPNIDIDILNKIQKDTVYYDIYYKVVNLITRRLRSEKEIREYIEKQNVPKKDEENIITRLKEIGFINDSIFTKAYISDRIHLSSDGPYKIKKELLQHDIDEDMIDEELNKIDGAFIVEKIKKLISKKIKNSKYTGYYLKQKVLGDMGNLGYERSLCATIFDSMDTDDSNLLSKEYERQYKKLSMKYDGQELRQKLKQRLYQRGFRMEEIETIIDKNLM